MFVVVSMRSSCWIFGMLNSKPFFRNSTLVIHVRFEPVFATLCNMIIAKNIGVVNLNFTCRNHVAGLYFLGNLHATSQLLLYFLASLLGFVSNMHDGYTKGVFDYKW